MKKILFSFLLILSFQLTAKEIDWTYPSDTLSTALINATDPQIAIDANGNAVAVWVESGLIKSKSKLVNMSWSAVASTLSNTGASMPRLVSDTNGNATAIWLEGTIVKASSKTLTGNWSTAVTLSSSGASTPAIAVDSAGDVIVAWARNSDIQTTTKLFGGNWSTAVTINSTNATQPAIAVSGSGASARAVVVWQGTSGTTNTVFASTKLLSGSWSAQQAVSTAGKQAGRSYVALDSNGNATAVWYQYNVTGGVYSAVAVQTASLPAGGAWSTSQPLSECGIKNPANLSARVGYDALGNAIAIWNTSLDDASYVIQSSIKTTLGNWTTPIPLGDLNLFSSDLSLATSNLGDALSLFMSYNGSSLLIQSAESDVTGFSDQFWSSPIIISSGTQNSNPRSAMSVSGNTIYVAGIWISNNGTNNSIQASTGTKALVLPPSGLAVTQSNNNFGVFTEYYNTLSWTASTDPSVVGYLIYRNGFFVTKVDASVTQIVDDNRVQNGSVTYGVAAVDEGQSHSRVITVSYP